LIEDKRNVDAGDGITQIELPPDKGFYQSPGDCPPRPGFHERGRRCGLQGTLEKFAEEQQIGILAAQGLFGAAGAVIGKPRAGSRGIGLFANLACQFTGSKGWRAFSLSGDGSVCAILKIVHEKS